MDIVDGLRLVAGAPTDRLDCFNCHSRMREAADEITRLRAELAECKRDAELWRAYQARKQAVIDAGMASNPMRAVAANMCPFCHSMIGAPHELWCRHSALAAKGD